MLNPRIISNHGFIMSSKTKQFDELLITNYWMFLKHNYNEIILNFTCNLFPSPCIIFKQHFGLVFILYSLVLKTEVDYYSF